MWTMKRKAAFSPFNIYWSGVPSAVRKPMLLRRTGGGTRTLHGSCESCQESLNLFSLKCGKTLSQWFVDMRHKPRRHTDTSDTQRMQMQRRSWKRLWLGPSWRLHISVIQRSRGFWRWEKYGKVMESMDETDEFLFHGPRSRAALPGPSPLWERRRCLGAKIGVVTMRMTLSVILTPWSQPVAAQLVPLSACHDVYAKGSWQLFLCESWWWWRPQRCLVILLQKIHWNILKHIETYWNILKHYLVILMPFWSWWWWERNEVPLLELAMRESVEMAQNSGVLKAPFCQHHDMSTCGVRQSYCGSVGSCGIWGPLGDLGRLPCWGHHQAHLGETRKIASWNPSNGDESTHVMMAIGTHLITIFGDELDGHPQLPAILLWTAAPIYRMDLELQNFQPAQTRRAARWWREALKWPPLVFL